MGSKRGQNGPFWGPFWVPEGYLGSSNTFRAHRLALGVETHFGHKNDQKGVKITKNGIFGPILGPVPGPPLKPLSSILPVYSPWWSQNE